MSAVFTTIFRVGDWQALRRLSDLTLIAFARASGARRYRIYRNSHDAAEALLLIEGAPPHALQLLRAALARHEGPAVRGPTSGPADPADGTLWEPAECSAIG